MHLDTTQQGARARSGAYSASHLPIARHPASSGLPAFYLLPRFPSLHPAPAPPRLVSSSPSLPPIRPSMQTPPHCQSATDCGTQCGRRIRRRCGSTGERGDARGRRMVGNSARGVYRVAITCMCAGGMASLHACAPSRPSANCTETARSIPPSVSPRTRKVYTESTDTPPPKSRTPSQAQRRQQYGWVRASISFICAQGILNTI
ncbi:hypothetical protein DFH08DRAFT_901004 [Mycena albidolilacea]|uniref:Uncharacterized protein n=1 Tax=Mycena albidolilacea TaxID=1033008 RepID=A0AAD7EAH2_9AGAR|nr:hypothetical protein DFH08DRAFT_901004 [Mycena albidolilacea]